MKFREFLENRNKEGFIASAHEVDKTFLYALADFYMETDQEELGNKMQQVLNGSSLSHVLYSPDYKIKEVIQNDNLFLSLINKQNIFVSLYDGNQFYYCPAYFYIFNNSTCYLNIGNLRFPVSLNFLDVPKFPDEAIQKIKEHKTYTKKDVIENSFFMETLMMCRYENM